MLCASMLLLLLLFAPYIYRRGCCCCCLFPMSTDAAAVVGFFPHFFPFLFVSIREHDLVAQPIAAAAPFPADVIPRAYRPRCCFCRFRLVYVVVVHVVAVVGTFESVSTATAVVAAAAAAVVYAVVGVVAVPTRCRPPALNPRKITCYSEHYNQDVFTKKKIYELTPRFFLNTRMRCCCRCCCRCFVQPAFLSPPRQVSTAAASVVVHLVCW